MKLADRVRQQLALGRDNQPHPTHKDQLYIGEGGTVTEEIIQALHDKAVNGELSCADAHEIARLFRVSPLEVGKIVNRASDLRFNRCQLGLFGYGPKSENKHKIVLQATYVPADIEAALQAKAQHGRISCADVWEIADRFKYPRLGIANIIETLGLKVRPCQLGCF